ncbi:MAG TPA: aldo/keto reductase [Bryobacteraceae bacterium]|nr:aldo/keto reductase [Bryobacteraceae bacterium]
MSRSSSRRNFLAAGLALPAAASAARSSDQAPPQTPKLPAQPPAFRYRTLGKTGLKVTTLGFGCMITSDGSVVERAADLGITYFDTARGYQGGNNERMVGAALKRKRKDLVLSTKTEGHGKQDSLDQLDTSLKELGTDYVDIWYLHGKTAPAMVTDDLMEALAVAKKAGKTRFVGVSTHGGQDELMPWLAKNPNIDVILTSYNFTMQPFMNGVIEEAVKAGKGIVAMKVMAGGTRRGRGGNPNAEKLTRPGALVSALKWVLRNPNVHTTIPSMTDMDQLEDNLKAMSQPFGDADEKILAMHLEQIAPYYCRMCGECAGQCRQNLPVADVLRFLTYADGYGQFALGREHYLELHPAHASAKCENCPGCTVACPYGVRVAERMARAQEMFA